MTPFARAVRDAARVSGGTFPVAIANVIAVTEERLEAYEQAAERNRILVNEASALKAAMRVVLGLASEIEPSYPVASIAIANDIMAVARHALGEPRREPIPKESDDGR